MKVNSMFIETLRFTFTRRIKGTDGKVYKYRAPYNVPFGYPARSDGGAHLGYVVYMFYVWSILMKFENPFTADNLIITLIFAFILMPIFRFLSYIMAIKGGCDVWECDTVPKFGWHPYLEAWRGTFLFRCKDAKGEYHRLSLVKFGLPTLFFIPILAGETYILRYLILSKANVFILFAAIIIPSGLYLYLLYSYGIICSINAEWVDVNVPRADDAEGGSEYKL